jgi:hypothetical protein
MQSTKDTRTTCAAYCSSPTANTETYPSNWTRGHANLNHHLARPSEALGDTFSSRCHPRLCSTPSEITLYNKTRCFLDYIMYMGDSFITAMQENWSERESRRMTRSVVKRINTATLNCYSLLSKNVSHLVYPTSNFSNFDQASRFQTSLTLTKHHDSK